MVLVGRVGPVDAVADASASVSVVVASVCETLRGAHAPESLCRRGAGLAVLGRRSKQVEALERGGELFGPGPGGR